MSANHNFAQYATPPHNVSLRVLDVNGHSGHESDLLDIFEPTATLELLQPPSPRPPLPRPLFRQLTLTLLLHHHFHPPSPRTRLHCPHCPRTFRHRMGLFGHMRIHESGIDRSLDTPTPPSPSPNPSPCAHTNHPTADIDATDLTTPHSSPSSSSSSFTATTTAASASVAHARTTATPDTTTGTTLATSIIRREGQDYICPHCDRTFTSRIGLVGHLRIHRTDTGEPVPGAPTYTHRTRLHCPHCPRTFTHRMGLFGHMRIHESGIDHNSDTATTSNTSTTSRPILAPPSNAPNTTTNTTASSTADTDTADLSCPHCPRTFTSRIGLVGHLRIHRTETGKPVPGAPTYTHRTRLHCPHCPRTFTHRMGLFGHMRIHDDLR
nr:unnamed protein product [Spirometra erinaceieuropaei]